MSNAFAKYVMPFKPSALRGWWAGEVLDCNGDETEFCTVAVLRADCNPEDDNKVIVVRKSRLKFFDSPQEVYEELKKASLL